MKTEKMKRVLTLVLIVITVVGSVIPSSAATYSTGRYVVTEPDGLNVRSGPGINYARITAIRKGTQINVTQISGNWGKYTRGWVHLGYCRKTSSPAEPNLTTVSTYYHPLKSSTRTTYFGENWNGYYGHAAIDLGGNSIGTPVRAMTKGRVIESKYFGQYGNTVLVESKSPSGKTFTHLYAHLDQRNVKVGEWVTAGQTIGRLGETGLAYGPHLHFAVTSTTSINKIKGWLGVNITNRESFSHNGVTYYNPESVIRTNGGTIK